MFRSHAGIIQAGADGMGQLHLAVAVLQQVTGRTVQHSRCAPGQSGGMLSRVKAATGGLNTYHTDISIKERVKQADGIASAANTGQQQIGHAAGLL